MILLELFLAFLQIGALSFGGGYAAMPLIQEQVITKHGWLSFQEFTDLVTIAEMTPGPIAINAATFVGNQMAGIPGALAATLGVILPSCLFVTLLAMLYMRYRGLTLMQGILGMLRPAVTAMILSAGLSILLSVLFVHGVFELALKAVQWRGLLLFAIALILLRRTKAHPILIMVGCGLAELAIEVFRRFYV